jgi:riboflavin kinase/FMN adenylyltransferase
VSILPLSLRHLPIIHGSARGRTLGIPTINVDPVSIPQDLPYGIYAGNLTLDGMIYPSVIHYGPRPVFQDSLSFEIHVLDEVPDDVPTACDVAILSSIREVQDFQNTEDLLTAIQNDIETARGMLEV